ncbi:CDP-glycerol glycerophosphotransferase family protein [Lachnospiraceae bacterium OttesenSCG-928-D06]|nr:CDP-glycerol glycerophosphotransferase family protein [Lachnospiraceae bacterium OttesenSCG-928-D06]
MGVKSYIRRKIIEVVKYAIREEQSFNKQNIDKDIISNFDRQMERWTWERFKRTEKEIEKWTWDRFQRTKNRLDELEEQIEYVNQNVLDIKFKDNKIEYKENEKIRVVMLFQIPSCWPSVESVWNVLVEDPRFETQMLLYDREQKEPEQMEGARDFLVSHHINFCEAEYYDFQKEKPHVFIYQTPWDDRHRPEFLKSHVIKAYGIRTVYLPYGIEYSASVRISWIFSIMQFRAKPWMSFVLSPQILLEHKCQSKYGGDFLMSTGLPKFDALYKKEQFILQDTLKNIIGDRQIVFWQMHFPALDGNEDYPEPNIEVYLEFAKKIYSYRNLFFLVRPHPKFFSMYMQKGYTAEVEEFKNILDNTENIFVYDEPDYRPALVNANYIIGDRSALMVEAIVLQVPVLYMTNFYYKEKMLQSVLPIFESYYQGSECYDMELFVDLIINRNKDYKRYERLQAMEKCIPFFDGQSGKRIVECIATALQEEV